MKFNNSYGLQFYSIGTGTEMTYIVNKDREILAEFKSLREVFVFIDNYKE